MLINMVHLPDVIRDLGFILMTAAVVILIFRRLKQPVVLGYLIAGFLVGPHVPWVPTITDTSSIHVWAEIGVIFLLFGLGLEFSFKKLAQVGKSASITALFEIFFMFGLGYFLGQGFGWTRMDSIFLGGILSVSSTTIIVRAVEELGLKTRGFVSLVFGVLIVEDLVAILLLVLLTTVAATQTLSGTELLNTTVKLGFFLLLWFIVGIYMIPLFLQRVRSLLTGETMLIVSIGLCLMMVLLATKSGFSPALGAFVMGSILAETREGKAIEHLIVPVKDLFAAIFFVSIGMLIEPRVIAEHFWIVIILTIATIFGKFISTAIGALISGQSLRHSVQSGLSLAQIGEFSFLIATLGISLKVTSEFLYPIAVTVSAFTTFSTPYQMRIADRFYAWMEKKIPTSTLNRINSYQEAVRGRSSEGFISLVWDLYGFKLLLNSVVVVALSSAIARLALPMVFEFTDYNAVARFALAVFTVLVCAPFFWPILLSSPSDEALSKVTDLSRFRSLQFGIALFRFLIAIFLLGFIVGQYYSLAAASVLLVLAFGSVVAFFGKHTEPLYRFFERKFISNLNEKEFHETAHSRRLSSLAPWDATLVDFTLSPDSDLIAKKLIDSRLKERFGVTIAIIQRGHKRILAPGRDEMLLPGDRLFVIGDDKQLESARAAIEVVPQIDPQEKEDTFGLDSFQVKENSEFLGKSIRECGLRERIHGLIVGIERSGQRILSPDSGMELLAGDVVWIVGDKSLMKRIQG